MLKNEMNRMNRIKKFTRQKKKNSVCSLSALDGVCVWLLNMLLSVLLYSIHTGRVVRLVDMCVLKNMCVPQIIV